jgi:hypothetical protein
MKPRNRRDRTKREADLIDLPPEIREKIGRVMALLDAVDESEEERQSTQAFIKHATFFHRCTSLKP